MALSRTLKKILRIKISEPTVIWSGNGYHIYLVLDAFVLETEDAFNNSKFGSNPSQKFLRFANGSYQLVNVIRSITKRYHSKTVC